MAISKVTGGGIADGSLSVSDIADDAVTAAKLANSINTDIGTGVTGNTTADAALPKAGGAMTGAITTNSTFDGRDVATDGTKLDTLVIGTSVQAYDATIVVDADIGTTANKIVQLDGAAKLPAVDGSQLTGLVGGGPSLGTLSVIRTNATTISENITIPSTSNGMSAGPITIADGYTVSVEGTWSIV